MLNKKYVFILLWLAGCFNNVILRNIVGIEQLAITNAAAVEEAKKAQEIIPKESIPQPILPAEAMVEINIGGLQRFLNYSLIKAKFAEVPENTARLQLKSVQQDMYRAALDWIDCGSSEEAIAAQMKIEDPSRSPANLLQNENYHSGI